MPGVIDTVVVKVAERCNLNCTYCYMYNHEDRSYLDRPRFMSDDVFDGLADVIVRYCDRRPGHGMTLLFHGGEPTLIGKRRFDDLCTRARRTLGPRLRLAIQTNAVLLDAEWADLFLAHAVTVGVSLDGPRAVNDRHRVTPGGRGSHDDAVRGLTVLKDAGVTPSVLCVVSPGRSGGPTYRHFRSLGIQRMNFLLPDVSHDNKQKFYGDQVGTPVARFLVPAFDAWYGEDDPSVDVGIFSELLAVLMGGVRRSDAFGNPRAGYVVVETDGAIEPLDALRVCRHEITRSDLNVLRHGFDDLDRGLPLLHQVIHEGLPVPRDCETCPERGVCGGGYLPHRYSHARGFDNPSVWCEDIKVLLGHMRQRITRDGLCLSG